ncbi:MAG: choice-of-anchor P family protein, partial [Nocardioidaceae bacterium]
GNNATTTSSSQVAAVNLLSGLITADLVRGESTSTADAFFATGSSAGSTFANLKILGYNNNNPITNVAPNTTVDIKNPLFPSQTVARAVLYEEGKTAAFVNGKFTSTHFVNMIHVELLKPFLGLAKGVEIIVGHANTAAAYPSGLACGSSPGLVSGDAATAKVNGQLLGQQFVNVGVDEVSITPLGGSASDGITANLPGIISNATVLNETSGSIVGNPTATSRSRLEQVNVLSGLYPGGLVTADVLDVRSTSNTTASTATTTFQTTFANVRVAGVQITVAIAPNSTIVVNLGALGFAVVVLNEQTFSNGVKDTFGTVNAVHVTAYTPVGQIFADVVVGHAHSDAHHP